MPPSMAAKMAAATTQARFGETFLFAVEIPRGRLRETERPGIEVIQEQTSAGRESDSMRVLVVEDDKKIASFVVKGLKQNGFAVDHDADGEIALIHATSTSYDAAVVDIMLPKLDGLSLVRQLRGRGVS